MISHVKQPIPSGTMPTSKFLPSHGSMSDSGYARRLTVPFAKIQPACKPIGSQSERVLHPAVGQDQADQEKCCETRRHQIGSANCENECAIELKPEVQVTTADVCSGALRKWAIEYRAEAARIDRYLCPVRRKRPRIRPRKNVSSIAGTIADVGMIWARASQSIVGRGK